MSERNQDIDIFELQRVATVIGLVVFVVIMTYVGLSSTHPIMIVGLILAPLVIYLIHSPPTWMLCVFALYNSTITLPGITQGLEAFHLVALGFVVIILAGKIISKESFGPAARDAANKPLLFFFVAIAIVISTRGFGIRALGGTSWGGMAYVQLFIAAAFLFASQSLVLTPKQWRTGLIYFLVASAIPAAAQVLFVVSGGQVYQQFSFIKAEVPALLTALNASQSGEGVLRFNLLGNVALTIFSLSMILIPFRGRSIPILVCLLAFVIVTAGLSGYRSVITTVLLTLLVYAFVVGKRGRLTRLVLLGVAGLMFWQLMIPLAKEMPLSFQRMVSWIPMVDVSPIARADAEGSTWWRVEIWKLAWHDVPDYLWIGKGFNIAPGDMLNGGMETPYDTIINAYLAHNYHNGPLSLVLDLGLLGLVTGSLFIILSCVEAYRAARAPISDPFLQRASCFFAAYYIATGISFFTIFGDARYSMTFFFVYLAILRGIRATARAYPVAKKTDAVAEKSTAYARRPLPALPRPHRSTV